MTLLAQCTDPGCGWKWEGTDREARERAAIHAEMFVDHEIVYAEPGDVAPTSYPCKVKGCLGRATSNRGRYALLCPDHTTKKPQTKRAKVSAPLAAAPPVVPSVTSSLDELAGAVRATRREAAAAFEAWQEAVARVSEEFAA